MNELSLHRLRLWRNEPDLERVEIKPVTREEIRSRYPVIQSHTLEFYYKDGSCKPITAYNEVRDALYCLSRIGDEYLTFSILLSGTDEKGTEFIREYRDKLAKESELDASHGKIQRLKDVKIVDVLLRNFFYSFYLNDSRQIDIASTRIPFPFSAERYNDFAISKDGKYVTWDSYDEFESDFVITLEDILLPKL